MRGKFLRKMFALAASACMLACSFSVGVQAQENESVKYVALGDSISSGYGVSAEQAFPSLVAADCGLELKNHAAEGAKSADLLAAVTTDAEVMADVAAADAITITIGGNDLMGALYSYIGEKLMPGIPVTEEQIKNMLINADLATLQKVADNIDGFLTSPTTIQTISKLSENLVASVAAIKAANPTVVIVVANQYNPYAYLANRYGMIAPQAKTISDVFESGLATMNASLASVANPSVGCFVVDVKSSFDASVAQGNNPCNADVASLAPNISLNLDFHPNADGHALIAQGVEAVINSVVASSVLEAQAAAIQSSAVNSVEDSSVNTAEAAQVWAETVIQSVLAEGVTATVQISDFQAAQAGTEENQAGTDGSFKAVVSLSYNGYDLENAAVFEVQIKATAYTAQVEDPEEDLNTEEDNNQTTEKPQPSQTADKDKDKTDKAEEKSPKTGDVSAMMPYVFLMLAAGAAVVVVSQKKFEKR